MAAEKLLGRILKEGRERRELHRSAGIDLLPQEVQKVAVVWLDTPTTMRQLLSSDPSAHRSALANLEQRLRDEAADPPSELEAIVGNVRLAVLDARDPAEAIRQEVGDLKGMVGDGLRELGEQLQSHPSAGDNGLPPTVARCLESVPLSVRRPLAEFLAARPSTAGFQGLLDDVGSLLAGAGWQAWEAAARMAGALGYSSVAAALWRRVETLSPDPVRAATWGALVRAEADPGSARAALERYDDGPLFFEVVRATLAEDHVTAASLGERLDSNGPDFLMSGMLVVQALALLERYDDAVALAERLASEPDAADALVQLAGVLLVRAQHGQSRDRTADLNRAALLAERGREMRYDWGLGASQAVKISVSCAEERADFADVARIAQAVRDAGRLKDLAEAEVATIVAMARLAEGHELDDVEGLGRVTRQFFEIVGAEMNDGAALASREDVSKLRALLREATDPSDRIRIQLALARRAELSEDDLVSVEGANPEAAESIRLELLVAQGKEGQALAMARSGATRSARRAWRLAGLLDRLGEDRQLINHVVAVWPRFHDVPLLNFALQAAIRVSLSDVPDRRKETTAIRDVARQAASRQDLTDTQRRRLLQSLFAIAVNVEEWDDAATWGESLLAANLDLEDPTRVRWMLAQVYVNSGWPDRAWRVLLDGDDLIRPHDVEHAKLASGLASTFGDDPRHVTSLLAHVEWGLQDANHVGPLVMGAWHVAHRLDDPRVGAAAAEAVERFLDEFPDNGVLQRVSVEDFMAPGGLDRFSPPVPPGFEALSRQVATGQGPMAYLAAITDRSYTEVLVASDGRYVYSGSNSLTHRQRERADAIKSLSGTVIVDATTLLTLARLDVRMRERDRRGVSELLVASFSGATLANTTALDLAHARSSLGLRPASVIAPPIEEGGKHQLIEFGEEVVQHRHAVVTAMWEIAQRLERVVAPSSGRFLPSEMARSNTSAALAAAELGAQGDLPVWADDAALRVQLRRSGITCFGTGELLSAMGRTEIVNEDWVRDVRRVLREVGVVLLPTPITELHAHAASKQYVPDGLAGVLSEPGWWAARANLARARPDRFFDDVIETAPDKVVDWFLAACVGMERQFGPRVPPRVLLHLLASRGNLEPHVQQLVDAWLEGATIVRGKRPSREDLDQAIVDVRERPGLVLNDGLADRLAAIQF